MKKINIPFLARIVFQCLAFGLFLCISHTANAATITVDTLNDEAGAGTNCSLREAMTAANNDRPFGGCLSGSGVDTILFSINGTIELNSQLPSITTSMNIVNSSGPANLKLHRNGLANYQIFLILSTPSVIRIDGVTISNGRSPVGAGIQNAATLTVSNSIVTENTAFQFAGGGIFNAGTLFVVNTTISGNTATPGSGRGGAGIENQGVMNVVNSTISGNRLVSSNSDCAGGISINSFFSAKIVNSTVTDNEGTSSGCAGGIVVVLGQTTISNSIVAGNRNNSNVPDVRGVFTSSTYNLVGSSAGSGLNNGVNGNQAGTMLSPLDPSLGALQDNGGPTPTHALLKTSRARNTGDSAIGVDPIGNTPLVNDQRGDGFLRNKNGGIDIGAFEAQEIPNTAPNIVSDPVSVQQGAGPVRSQIAVISDSEDPAGALSVTIDNGTSASSNGVTISNLTVDATGRVTADVQAACSGAEATFALRVSDSGALASDATLTVHVTASRAPVITLKPSLTLFPPNHKYISIGLSEMVGSVSDDCDVNLQNSIAIDSVQSDEADNAAGDSDGETVNDVVIANDCRSVQLRAERDEAQDGRVYTIIIKVTDSSGNSVLSAFKVGVPINKQRQPVDSGSVSVSKGQCS